MSLKGKRLALVGFGASGRAVARLIIAQGANLSVFDERVEQVGLEEFQELGVEFFLGRLHGPALNSAELIIVSPGIPSYPELEEIAARKEVIGEVEFSSRYLKNPILAVGGTNGKSTTTSLLDHLVRGSGLKTFAGANLGRPSAEAVDENADINIWEVSSFQMERIAQFHPKVAILLNITEDHLDRYKSFDDYAVAKGHCFVNQQSDDLAIIPANDPICLEQARRGKAKLCFVGEAGDYQIINQTHGFLVCSTTDNESYDVPSSLAGKHNAFNCACAIAAARHIGIGAEKIRQLLPSFAPLGHRMALAGVVAGVNYYDDSKATNVGAAVTAVGGFPGSKVILIAGGRDKWGAYEPLIEAMAKNGRAWILLGEGAQRISEAIPSNQEQHRVASMQEAVQLARNLAQSGDTVLLSPACSSFDMYRSYAERGDDFVAAVRALEGD